MTQTEISVQPDSILSELKRQTEHQHRRTEANVNLMDEDFTLADYRELLTRFYAFYKPFEEKMREAIAQHRIELNYGERLNTPKLFSDLRSLGLSAEAIDTIPLVSDLPALDSREKVFGSLYVVEGSTLGGQVIARHLKAKFDLDVSNGAAFFSGYQKDTGKMWNEFKNLMTNFAAEESDWTQIIGAANETFEKINNSLSR